MKVLSIFGTRPEAIKMAPLVRALEEHPQIKSQICLTAQHREMLDSVMDLFDLQSDFDLNIMEPGQNLYTITSKMLLGLGEVLREAKPDLVLVHGDTSTTFCGALAAFYAKIPVGHVEAGLRSGDSFSPYPEEMNRKMVGQISSLHFAPTVQNKKNLAVEGITGGVFVTGNTVIDAMDYTIKHFSGTFHSVLDDLDFQKNRVVLLTCHRRENYGKPMEEIFAAVRILVEQNADIQVVYPVHPAPVVQETAQKYLGDLERVHLIAPLDTIQMHALMQKCYFVMTDSGGLQEEAPALGKPVLVLRKETERPEAIAAGTAALAGVEKTQILHLAQHLLDSQEHYDNMAKAVNPYGDGMASKRIVDAILWHFGHKSEAPNEFLID